MSKAKRVKIIGILCLALLFTAGCAQSRTENPSSAAEMKTESETETSFMEETPETESAPLSEAETEFAETEVETELSKEEGPVVLGNERFEEYMPLLSGKRVAILTNQTGIIGGTDTHILDALLEKGIDVTAVFSPEHGFRGFADAGETVENAVDEKTGVPLISLYGNGRTNEPSQSDLERFDTVVIDIQDVGLRYFTYYISMYYMMDACAAAGKDVIILDRPNPNGFYVDGPILRVGQLPVPVVYGMTWGELAQMINGEGWLDAGKDACKLTVIPCLHYTHQTKYELPVMPSPNLKDMHAIYLYPSTCYFENTIVSVGRGTGFPFNIYGSPYFAGIDGYSYTFVPESMVGAKEPPFLGETCYGVDLTGKSEEEIWENQIDLSYLIGAYQASQTYHPELSFFGKGSNGRYFVDLLFGTDSVRLMIEEGKSAAEIKDSWQEELESFREQRRPYLLYEE